MNTYLDYLLAVAAVRTDTEDPVVLILLIIHPVDPVALLVKVHVENVVT